MHSNNDYPWFMSSIYWHIINVEGGLMEVNKLNVLMQGTLYFKRWLPYHIHFLSDITIKKMVNNNKQFKI